MLWTFSWPVVKDVAWQLMAGGCRLHRRVGQFKVDDPGHYYSVANTPLSPHLTRSATLACLLARSASPSRAQVEFAWKTD